MLMHIMEGSVEEGSGELNGTKIYIYRMPIQILALRVLPFHNFVLQSQVVFR